MANFRNSLVRGRFAPTPSGYMHIGNALTALLAWLRIRSQNGVFVLRIEDLDFKRLQPGYSVALMEDLRWLGLDWDEGPDVSGPYGPYRQSQRIPLYQKAFNELKENGRLYPCFCSRKQRLSEASAPHGLASEGPWYNGSCRYLSSAERIRRAREKLPAWRFILPNESVEFDDLVVGRQSFPPGMGGDFIVFRADGVFSYQLAVVVDDAAMGITEVVRGDDLLDSTPRQLHLYHSLHLTPPKFAHVPLVCTSDGERLAKRNKLWTLHSLRQNKVTPEQLVGYLAWLAGLMEKRESVRPRDLISSFDIGRIVRNPVCISERWRGHPPV